MVVMKWLPIGTSRIEVKGARPAMVGTMTGPLDVDDPSGNDVRSYTRVVPPQGSRPVVVQVRKSGTPSALTRPSARNSTFAAVAAAEGVPSGAEHRKLLFAVFQWVVRYLPGAGAALK
jgi:hypothetical protein